ncbi:MAG: hypothetical protein FWE74_11170 [Oscillospiraceae bacterium]|nr:hypothetical protein [Oscillospiraceae bacterium]
MNLALIDLIAILMTIGSLVSVFSLLYAKFIKPIKKVISQVDNNTRSIKNLEEEIQRLKSDRVDDDTFTVEVRGILFESLIAILDGLEQGGANHTVAEQKKKLIKFMSQQIGAKKPELN